MRIPAVGEVEELLSQDVLHLYSTNRKCVSALGGSDLFCFSFLPVFISLYFMYAFGACVGSSFCQFLFLISVVFFSPFLFVQVILLDVKKRKGRMKRGRKDIVLYIERILLKIASSSRSLEQRRTEAMKKQKYHDEYLKKRTNQCAFVFDRLINIIVAKSGRPLQQSFRK